MSVEAAITQSRNFRSLSPSVSLYEPAEPAKGQLIIIAAWLGGTAKHIAKYTSLWQTVAPNSKILLIKASLEGFLAPYPIQRRIVRPAIEPMLQTLKECEHDGRSENTNDDTTHSGPAPRIMLHIFSNGGANNVLQLLHAWKSETGVALPLCGIVVDSAFAVGGPKQNYRGFQQSIPKGLVYGVVGPMAATYALFVLELSIALGRYPRPETAMRLCIFDENLVQINWPRVPSGEDSGDNIETCAKAKRICYFASKADQNTPFQDIIIHSREAKERGWDVNFHLWDDTPHCNHLGRHEEEYREAITRMWEGKAAKEHRVRSKL